MSKHLTYYEKVLAAWNKKLAKWHKQHPKPKPPVPKPVKVFMFDSVTITAIPRTAKYAAGYVDGHWQTYLKIKLRCPRAKIVSIAVFPQDNADVLDCEPGDATIGQAPAWVKLQISRRKSGVKYGTKIPWVYTSAANGEALIAAMTKAGLKLGVDYEWWSAHYSPTLGAHLCHPGCYPGLHHAAAATQYTNHALGTNCDESLVSSSQLFT